MLFALISLTSSCSKTEDVFKCTVTYDVELPKNLADLVDAYAEFNDNGNITRELIVNGNFHKTFSYKWEDDNATSTHPEFSSLKIYMKSKVSSSDLKEGTKLLKDSKAYMYLGGNWIYNHDKDNAWTGNSSSTSQSGELGGRYLWSSEIQNYSYTIQEQIDYLKSLETIPYISFSIDHVGNTIKRTLISNVGQENDESRGKDLVNVSISKVDQ